MDDETGLYRITPHAPVVQSSEFYTDRVREIAQDEIREDKHELDSSSLKLVKKYRNSGNIDIDDTSIDSTKTGPSFKLTLPGGPVVIEFGGDFLITVVGNSAGGLWLQAMELWMDDEQVALDDLTIYRLCGATTENMQLPLMKSVIVSPSTSHPLKPGEHTLTIKLRNDNTDIDTGGTMRLHAPFVSIYEVGFDERVESD
jgi:hypothetical protein